MRAASRNFRSTTEFLTQLNFDKEPGRQALLDAISGHVLVKGLHIGIYERP